MIYFCIPAYNEERTVGVVLWKLRQVMGELRRDYQIIVVDDASTDSTPSVLNPYIRVLPLTVLRNPVRRGYADSLEIAIREALHRAPYPKRDLIITLQADFTEDPDVAPAMIKRIEAGADVVGTEVQVEPAATRKFRWGRKLFRWLLRGKQWAEVGDPLSGLRAYRVMVLKRALEARPNGRLLTWRGWAANAELLAQALPHSRRNEVVESTLLMHRHQRDSRFSLSAEMREARGAASGRPAKNATALPLDAKIVTPQAVVAESKNYRSARHDRGERPQRGRRPDRNKPRGERQERPARLERAARPERPARPERVARPERPPRPERPAAIVAPTDGQEAPRKKRRPRRRKKRGTQTTQLQGTENELTLSVDNVPTENAESSAPAGVEGVEGVEGEVRKKKSRRGRRGGRGRRRGPRPDGNNENNGNNAAPADEGPPPMAAEGD